MITVMKQALEALENTSPAGFNMESDKKFYAAITSLRQAIAEAEKQEPSVHLAEWADWRNMVVANLMRHANIDKDFARRLAHFYQSSAPQRQWVGLTDEQIGEIAVKSQEGVSPHDDTLRFARAIEAKLKEKNT